MKQPSKFSDDEKEISELCDFLDKRVYNRNVLKDSSHKEERKPKVVSVSTSGKVMMLQQN